MIITLSGFAKTDLIHDFQAINTPAKFTTSTIVVPGRGNGQTTLFLGSWSSSRMANGRAFQ